MIRRRPKREIVWGCWHQNVGWFSFHLTRSDARRSFQAPYDNWQMAERDGWKIIKCHALPITR